MEPSDRKIYLAEKFREVGSSGKKIHVIFRKGHWVLINESSKRAIGIYRLKQQATRIAKSLLENGLSEVVIFHNKNGSIEHMEYSENTNLQYAVV